MTNETTKPVVTQAAPPLQIKDNEGREILRLDSDGKLTLDPANVDEAARRLVECVRQWCGYVGAGNPFDFPASQAVVSQDLVPVAWQPIETAPQDGTRLLLFTGEVVTGSWEEGYTHGWEDYSGHHISPTHWMLPPAAPGGTPLYPASAIEAAQIAARNDAL